jgi:hypothetical protein
MLEIVLPRRMKRRQENLILKKKKYVCGTTNDKK